MATMLHSEFDYNTTAIKSAIKHGEAAPTTCGRSDMTTFPLSLPLTTRTSLADLSFLTGESQAEIIRQAISKILAEGPDGVIRTSEIRATAVAAERAGRLAGEAAVRAERASRRALAAQERGNAKAQEKATKDQEKVLRIAPVLETQDAVNPGPSDPEQAIVNGPVVQLDRPEPPSPAHIWVRGAANRWGGYWRAPKGQRTV